MSQLVGFPWLAIGVRHFSLAPVAEQKGLAARGWIKVVRVVEMMLFHAENEICPARQFEVELLCPMITKIDLMQAGHLPGSLIGTVIDESANAGRTNENLLALRPSSVAEKGFGQWAAADVARAKDEYLFEHGASVKKPTPSVEGAGFEMLPKRLDQAVCLRRRIAARPAMPRPSRAREAGSGT